MKTGDMRVNKVLQYLLLTKHGIRRPFFVQRIIKEDYKENPTDELKNILKVFARQNNISVDEVIKITTDNATTLFDI